MFLTYALDRCIYAYINKYEPMEIRSRKIHSHSETLTTHLQLSYTRKYIYIFFFYIIYANNHKRFSLVICVYFPPRASAAAATSRCFMHNYRSVRMRRVCTSFYYYYHVCGLERFFGFSVFAKAFTLITVVTRKQFSLKTQ